MVKVTLDNKVSKLRWILVVLVIMVATYLAGELKVIPYNGTFRIGLGSAVFFFLLLLYQVRFLPLVGLLVGLFVCTLRLLFELAFGIADLYSSYVMHFPAAWYYISFALLLYLIRFPRLTGSPLLLGLLGAMIDIVSNVVELIARMLIEQRDIVILDSLPVLMLVGLLRSFLVVGIYNMLEIRQLRAVNREQRKRVEKLLLILSELHEERLYLQKMMEQVEQTTVRSYQLYRKLADHQLASEALRLAEEVHDVKKDAQRIVAGLSKLIRQEKLAEQMALSDVANLVAKANRKYAEHLGKEVNIRIHVDGFWETKKFYSLLSVLNNIVANAVEAITYEGEIVIEIFAQNDNILIEVSDNGPGINERDREVIFQPGYTTKYDQVGNASTGIGLAHVLSTLHDLSGTVEVGSSRLGGAWFRIVVPVNCL